MNPRFGYFQEARIEKKFWTPEVDKALLNAALQLNLSPFDLFLFVNSKFSRYANDSLEEIIDERILPAETLYGISFSHFVDYMDFNLVMLRLRILKMPSKS